MDSKTARSWESVTQKPKGRERNKEIVSNVTFLVYRTIQLVFRKQQYLQFESYSDKELEHKQMKKVLYINTLKLLK